MRSVGRRRIQLGAPKSRNAKKRIQLGAPKPRTLIRVRFRYSFFVFLGE